MNNLRSKLIRLAHTNPALRPHILPLLTRTAQDNRIVVDQKTFDSYFRMNDAVETLRNNTNRFPEMKKDPAIQKALEKLEDGSKEFDNALDSYQWFN